MMKKEYPDYVPDNTPFDVKENIKITSDVSIAHLSKERPEKILIVTFTNSTLPMKGKTYVGLCSFNTLTFSNSGTKVMWSATQAYTGKQWQPSASIAYGDCKPE